MTKSTITREQLRALAVKKIESLKFAITQSAFTNIRRGLEDELQLAKFALAAMDSEPVTQDEREAFEAFMAKRFGDLVDQRRAKNGGYGYMAWDMVVAWTVWQARAAMLQAEPVTTDNKLGNSPVIPDTWIPVSERMPEDEQEVLTINRMGHRFVSFFDKHSGLFFDRLDAPAACCLEHVLVTHWMPLPAAPQEVQGE
ncbi:DUF551 domain-containing protein [Klebsiella aerogenes]